MTIPQTTEALPRIAEVIASGGVIAFRTDTFYGLGADPFHRSAVANLKQLKGKEASKPILVVMSDADQIDRFIAERGPTFDRLAEKFWPGPLTLIGKAARKVPPEITADTGTIGMRIPDDDEVRSLIRSCGGALTATSANPSGREPSRNAADVERYFGDAIDLIVDGGDARIGRPSTVVNVSESMAALVREGVIAWSWIQAALKGSAGV